MVKVQGDGNEKQQSLTPYAEWAFYFKLRLSEAEKTYWEKLKNFLGLWGLEAAGYICKRNFPA